MNSSSVTENNITNISNKDNINKTTTYYQLIWNKKWLLLGIVFLILVLGFIYYNNNTGLTCPFSLSVITQKQKNNKNTKIDDNNCDHVNDILELENDPDGWNLEDEMGDYMKKQHEILGE